jgi:signal transduction histidine kinase
VCLSFNSRNIELTACYVCIEDAIEHNDADSPTIYLEMAEDNEGQGVVRITDDGPGIPQHEREALLINHGVTPLNHGTGLGLIFVHWIARLSGDSVTIEDAAPRGSTVTISF